MIPTWFSYVFFARQAFCVKKKKRKKEKEKTS
jgi:hypothetical protein